MRTGLAAAALVALAFAHLPFARTDARDGRAHFDFTYDDADFVTTNGSIRSIGSALAAFARPFPPDQPERGLYRPLTNLSYAVDYALFEDDARGYHALQVALYALVALLVFSLARALLSSELAAFAVALVFTVHPVHCEAVDSIAARSELLALGFALASWRLFHASSLPGAPRRRGLEGLSALAYALACLSKETGALLPAVLVLFLLARDGAPDGAARFARRAFDATAIHIAVLLLYLAARFHVLGGLGPSAPVLAGIDLETRIITMGSVFAEYLRLSFVPTTLQLDFYYQQAIGVPSEWTLRAAFGWLGIACLLGAFASACASVLRGARTSIDDARGAAIAGLGTFFVFLAPVSHVVGIGALMAERFLFAPSFGLVLCAVALARLAGQRWIPRERARVGAAALALAALAAAGTARSVARAAEWRDGVALWESASRAAPRDYRSYSNIATHWIARGELDHAEQALLRALALEPGDRAVLANLAVVHLERGDLDAAEAIQRELLSRNPNDFVAIYNLGQIALRRFDATRALEHFERARALNPNFAQAAPLIAEVSEKIEKARQFVEDNERAAGATNDPKLLLTYARACRIIGDVACAEAAEARANQR